MAPLQIVRTLTWCQNDARPGVSQKAELLGRGAVRVEPGRKERQCSSFLEKEVLRRATAKGKASRPKCHCSCGRRESLCLSREMEQA